MRKINCPCPEAPTIDKEKAMYEKTYTIKVVTPMVGGGADAGKIDRDMPIRATSIRGHLRFWWRVLYGRKFDNLKRMKDAESKIWGSTEAAGDVSIYIEKLIAGSSTKFARYNWNPRRNQGRGAYDLIWLSPFDGYENPLQYIAFPFTGKDPNSDHPIDPNDFLEQTSFDLNLTCSKDNTTEVTKALQAWIFFGGIGARTRRGFGSLYSGDLSPKTLDDSGLKSLLETELGANNKTELTSISNVMALNNKIGVMQAWKNVVQTYKEFRQEPHGRRPRPNANQNLGKHNLPGRSYWPEPESIREGRGTRAKKHQRLDHIPTGAYPRAELGLPIVFHFMGQYEPEDIEVHPSGNTTRMASPFILKPLAVSEKMAFPIIVTLESRGLDGIKIIDSKSRNLLATKDMDAIQNPEFENYRNSPLKGLSKTGSAKEGFINFVKQHKYGEII